MYVSERFTKVSVASKWVKPHPQFFVCLLNIIKTIFPENYVAIALTIFLPLPFFATWTGTLEAIKEVLCDFLSVFFQFKRKFKCEEPIMVEKRSLLCWLASDGFLRQQRTAFIENHLCASCATKLLASLVRRLRLRLSKFTSIFFLFHHKTLLSKFSKDIVNTAMRGQSWVNQC